MLSVQLGTEQEPPAHFPLWHEFAQSEKAVRDAQLGGTDQALAVCASAALVAIRTAAARSSTVNVAFTSVANSVAA